MGKTVTIDLCVCRPIDTIKRGSFVTLTRTGKRKAAQDRKAEILRTALDLAFDVGPDMVTTGMIASRMGLTQPSIYKHFSSKEDIWIQVAEFLTRQISENLARCREGTLAPDARLRMQVADHLDLIARHPALPEIMVLRDLHKGHAALRERIMGNMTAFHAVLVANFRAAQEKGIFRRQIDAPDAASLLLGVIQSLVLRMMLTRDPAILRRDGMRLLDLQLSCFARDGGPDGGRG